LLSSDRGALFSKVAGLTFDVLIDSLSHRLSKWRWGLGLR
jgi:hypothetical protein